MPSSTAATEGREINQQTNYTAQYNEQSQQQLYRCPPWGIFRESFGFDQQCSLRWRCLLCCPTNNVKALKKVTVW